MSLSSATPCWRGSAIAALTLAVLSGSATIAAAQSRANEGANVQTAAHLVQFRVAAVASVLASSAPVTLPGPASAGPGLEAAATVRVGANMPYELRVRFGGAAAQGPDELWVAVDGGSPTLVRRNESVAIARTTRGGLTDHQIRIRVSGLPGGTAADPGALDLRYEAVPLGAMPQATIAAATPIGGNAPAPTGSSQR